jgi:hypothetical protein
MVPPYRGVTPVAGFVAAGPVVALAVFCGVGLAGLLVAGAVIDGTVAAEVLVKGMAAVGAVAGLELQLEAIRITAKRTMNKIICFLISEYPLRINSHDIQ